MPCIAPVRGKTDLINPWEPLTDNDPCGMPIITGVGGVDVSAQSLCRPHYAMKYGEAAIPPPAVADPATVLLLHGESLSDEKGHTITKSGNAAVSAAQSKFGGSSFLFDGAGGTYLFSPDAPEWTLAGDFTIECWVYFTDLATPPFILVGQTGHTAGSYSWMFRHDGANLRFYGSADGAALTWSYAPAWAPVINTWYHVAAVRTGTSLTLYVNGTSLGGAGSLTGPLFDTSLPLSLGGTATGQWRLKGHLDEVRISNVARWTSNFSVPTAPYT